MHERSDIGTRLPGNTLRGDRLATALLFFVNGIVIASWIPRIPGVQAGLGLTPRELGLALFFAAVGSLAGMTQSPKLVTRYGAVEVAVWSGVFLSACLPVLLYARSYPALCATLAALGVVNGIMGVAMNTYAVVVENAAGRPLMSALHGFFSFGGLIGAFIAAGALKLRLAVEHHTLPMFAAALAMLVVVRALATLDSTDRAQARAMAVAKAVARTPWSPRLLILGALLFTGLMAEGAMADWTAVFLVNVGALPATAALGFAAYSMAMAIGRFAGDRLVRRHGARTVLTASATLALAGLGSAVVGASPWASIAGFAAVGLGLANIVPLLFRAAAADGRGREHVALAAVAGVGYFGFLAGPPLIGLLAEHFGLRVALALLLPPMSALFLAARLTGPRRARARVAPSVSTALGKEAAL